jgi:hypothetical protein
MATFSFTRLSSGTVKVVTADDTYFIPGDCKVDPNNTLNRIVITDRYGAKITMDSATDTINIAGVQNTGTATEIAEDLATDIFFLASSGGAAAWGDITGTLSDQSDLNTALNARALITPPRILAYQALGSTIIAEAFACSLNEAESSTNLSSGVMIWVSVYLTSAQTITGVKFRQYTQGNFTGSNENSISLYSYSGGTITRVAVSANDANIWKGASSSTQAVPFGTPYTASAGVYYIGLLYSQSAQTTAPALFAAPSLGDNTIVVGDFTNSARFVASVGGRTSSPASIAMSSIGNNGSRFWLALY